MKTFFAAMLFLIAAAAHLTAQSPVELWKDFDPDAGAFNEEIIREETKDGVFFRDSYISAYHLGEEIRVFCKYAVNADAKGAPGLMDVHGWMGGPNPDLSFVNDGWAVMAHDYCGKVENRQHYTKYPPKLKHGNMGKPRGTRILSKMPDGSELTDPKQTDDFLWYVIQRRVLSYLIAQDQVDKDRIGAKGYSYGGTIMWNLGMDPRVKAIVAYFGVGWLEYYRTRGVWMYNQPVATPPPTPGETVYLSTIAPQSHAPYITAPALWLNGSNDHHGGHERGEQTFKKFNPSVPWSFAHQPRGHHDTQSIGHNAKLWLDKHVLGKDIHWPAPAQSKIVLGQDGVPQLHVTPADPNEVSELKMFYALKNPISFGRAWRDTKAVRSGNTWIGQMPVLNVDDYVFGFSNIQYKNTVVRSSPFTAAIPSKLGDAKATDKPSSRLGDGTGTWTNVGPVEGKGGVKGFRVLSRRGTLNQQFSDPKWQAPAGTDLSFKFYCTQPQTLTMLVNNHNEATIEMTASDDWQQMTLKANRFTNRFNKKRLNGWQDTQRIDIKPAPGADITKVVFADFTWATSNESNSADSKQEMKPPKSDPPAKAKPIAEPISLKKLPPGQRVYLTKQMASVADSFVKVVNDRSWQGDPIRVGGKHYGRGLGVHADSKLVYFLNGEFSTFHVVPGPDDAHHGQIEMKILVDDKVAFASGATTSKDKLARKPLKLPVVGAKKLTLLVSSLGARGGDHASWAEAYLERPNQRPAATNQKRFASTHVPRESMEPFLKKHCFQCHGPDENEGGVRFDVVSWEINNNDSAQRWQDVLDQLNSGDMPPEGETQPSPKELSAALEKLTGAILTARKRLTDHGGEIKMRRLNRREYSNTIHSLFGFDVPYDDIPEDGETTFDTIGAEQTFNASHFEKYLELGTRVAQAAFRWNTRKHEKVKKTRVQPEAKKTPELRKRLADLDAKMAMKKAGKTWKEMGFKDEGEAEIIFRQFDSRAGLPRRYLQYPLVDQGLYLSDVAKWATVVRHTDIRGDYIIRLRGGAHESADEIRKIVRVSDNHGLKGTLKILGTPETPAIVQMRTRQSMGRLFMPIRVRENMPNFTENTTRGYLIKLQGTEKQWEPWAAIWLDWLELEGPFYPKQRPVLEEILYPGMPTGGHSEMRTDEKSRELIERFAFEAFRHRTPEPDFINALHERFLADRKAGKRSTDAMAEVFGIVLASPAFLYLREEAEKESRELDNRELAIRLAYFLWSCPPDKELYSADLFDSNVLKSQVNRMLDDPRFNSFRDGFINQWAELDRFDAITIDEKDHFRFNAGVHHAAKQEVREFFGQLIKENLPMSNLIDSDFVMINAALANHYGIDGVQPNDDQFQKVTLPSDSARGGMITQAAFLTTGSNGERSSPVIRGALVMEKLLHDKPAPPPPNVPELSAASKQPKTNREMVQLHQKQAVCASCHKKMDVIGFGLENFDTIGMWRDTEKVGRKQVPIDPAGTLPGGQKFANVNELKEHLLASEDRLAQELVESMLAYGLGRTIEFSDADDVAQLLAKLKTGGYRVRSAIQEIVASPLFRKK